jgi:glycosyltransferase involved in cell wall biosynthesis
MITQEPKISAGSETNTTLPVVSVVMCVYNDERNVGKSIESILKQTFTDFEFIVVNDGSTDKTSEILNQYAEKDPRIKVFHKSNSGAAASANYGISKAQGKYIARIDSDDISYPHRLQTEVDLLNKNPNLALVGGGCHMIDQSDNIMGVRNIKVKNEARTLLFRNIFQQSDVMFRKSVFENLGGYREKFKNGEDYDLWLRISEVAEIKKINNILGQWRLNAGGYSFSRRKEQLDVDKVIKLFARQRRKKGEDDYKNYSPSVYNEHRNDISDKSYKIWITVFLLDSYRKTEARNICRQLLKESLSYKVILLYLATFLPAPILKWFNLVRNIIKNNF